MAFEIFKRLFGTGGEADRRRSERVSAREGTRVLVIDDSATIVAVLGKMLRQNGYQVLSAGDAETGVEIAKRERPDLIFLDIVLPGMNGFAALRLLRRDEVTQRTPIIMISGNMQATEQFYAQRIGADDFMKKPFGRGEVFSRLHKLIDAGRIPPHDGGGVAAVVEESSDIPDIAMPDPRDMDPDPTSDARSAPAALAGSVSQGGLDLAAAPAPAPAAPSASSTVPPPVTERPDV